MTVLVLDRVSLDVRSPRLDRHFDRGLSVLVAEDVTTLDRLHRVVAGVSAPRRGQARWTQRDPLDAPDVRARLGTLFPYEPPLEFDGSVADYLNALGAQRARVAGAATTAEPSAGEPFRFDSAFDLALEKRAAASLDERERRRVALRLAVATPNALGFVLHDPAAAASPDEQAALFAWLREVSARSLVLLTTTDRRAAERWSRETFDISTAAPRGELAWSLLLRVERPREVASAVLRDGQVLRAEVDPRRPDELLLSGEDPAALRHAAQKAIVTTRVDVTEMSLLARSPRAASDARARGGHS